jgi:hypothetical protein
LALLICFFRQEEAEKRRAEMKAAMQKKPEQPKEEPKQEVELVKEETPRAPEIDDVPLPTSKPKTGGEAPSWEEYMKQIQEEEAKNPTRIVSIVSVTYLYIAVVSEVKKSPNKVPKKPAAPVDPEEEEKKKKR